MLNSTLEVRKEKGDRKGPQFDSPHQEWIIWTIIKADTVTDGQRCHSRVAAICLCFTPVALSFTPRLPGKVSNALVDRRRKTIFKYSHKAHKGQLVQVIKKRLGQ